MMFWEEELLFRRLHCSYVEFEFDASGNALKRTSYREDGSIISRNEYWHDDNGIGRW